MTGKEDCGNIVKSAAELLSLDGDSPDLKETGKQLAQTTRTLATLVNVTLLPIAAVNFGYTKAKEYFEGPFRDDLEEKTNKIPKNKITDPPASIAAPILQGLAFSHDEKDLKDMYLELLTNAMDCEKNDIVHPAYVDVIRQLTPIEAYILRKRLCPPNPLPIINLNKKSKDSRGVMLLRKNLVDFELRRDIDGGKMLSSMIDNWVRSGLFSITFETSFVSEARYSYINKHSVYRQLVEQEGDDLEIEKGILRPIDFGEMFAKAAIDDS